MTYDACRPDETALDRIEWLRLFGVQFEGDDAQMDNGILMDACDYRGQLLSTVATDCAQVTGRSYWLADS